MTIWLTSSDVVDQLELSEITARYERESRGTPYHPRMMVKVLLRQLRRGGVLPTNRPAAPRGHSLPGAGCEQHAGFPHHLGLPKGQSGCAVGPVHAGIGVVPAGGTGEAGSRGVGRHQGEGQRIQAQGDELRSDAKQKEAQLAGEVEELLRQAQEVDDEEDRCGTDRASAGRVAAGVGFSGGAVAEDTGGDGGVRGRGAGGCASRPRPSGKGHSGVPEDSSVTSMLNRTSCLRRADGTSCRLTTVGGGGQRPPGDRGGSGHRPDFGQAAGGGDGGGDHRQRRRSLPKRCPPTQVTTLHRRSKVCTGWVWTRSSRRSGPATAGLCRQRPEVAYASHLSPRDRMRRKLQTKTVFGNATLCGCKRWSRCSARSSRAEASASSYAGPGEGQRRVVADLHRPQPAQTVPLWGGSASRNTDHAGLPEVSRTSSGWSTQ